MTKEFTNKTSYSLLKSNPKLTGNIKLVVDSKGDIFIESIDSSIELSRNKYKRVKLDTKNTWSGAIYDFFKGGNIPTSILYGVKDNENFFNIKKEFSSQYYTDYQQGATPKISKLYEEEISYFAPLWLEPNDIPEYFGIFKIKEPVSVSTKGASGPYTTSLENQIYNTNYLKTFGVAQPETESDYFYKTILSKAKLHKVFDMGPESIIGTYLRNHINSIDMPENSLTIDWNINKQSTVNGISLKKSGFTKESFNLFSEAFPVDRTITEFDNLITNQFQLNGVIHPNIINLEFLFDDESNDDFEINRYFGIYFNRKDISNFKLDGEAFYTKKNSNLPQNKEVKSKYDIDILSNNNIVLENENGVKLFTDYENNYKLLSSDIKGSNLLPYIYSTDGIFYDINNNVDWGDNEIILKDTFVNSNNFKGFKKQSIGIIPAINSNTAGRSYFEFKILGNANSFELRIKSVDSNSSDFDINQIFVGDTSLEHGTSIGNKFSLAGFPDDIATSIVSAINNYSNRDEDFNVYAISRFDKVIVFTRGMNEFWNNYQFLIYSDDANFVNTIDVPYNNFETEFEYNAKRLSSKSKAIGATYPFLDYNKVVTNASPLSGQPKVGATILHSNFIGGNNDSSYRIRIPIEFREYFNLNLFLKTQNWYSKIVSISAYLDEPIYENGRIVNFNNFDEYLSINCTDNIYVSSGAYCQLYEIESNKVGLMSLYPIKQFDIDQFRSDYGRDGDGDINKLEINYNIKGGTGATGSAKDIKNNIESFKQTGFKRLCGKLNEKDGSISKITNEYDRLQENQIPQLSIKGRIIPFINKWVYDDEGKDVRDNNYRLNSNSAFSYDNFSPSSIHKLPDFRFYTHEWYYLGKYPTYLTTKQKIDSYSYFDEYLDKNDLYSINNDTFTNYFTQYSVDNVSFPRKTKYSFISGGNSDSFGQTFFRGAKIKFKRRVENKTPLNFNIENIGVFPSTEFNDYKFSAILTNSKGGTSSNFSISSPLVYNIIENKKFKTITMVIEASLDDYYLNRDTAGNLFLDRSSLYVIKDKYNSDGSVSDTILNGAISPFTLFSKNFIVDNGIYTIFGLQHEINGSLPSFDKQIVVGETGKYSSIEIVISNSKKIVIDNIISVTSNTIKAKTFQYISNGTSYPITINSDSIPNTNGISPKYIKGGFNAYKSIIEDISFASIFDKVNNGSSDINYITINNDGTIESNSFIIEFEDYSTNAKSDYITTEPIIFNGLKNNDFKPLGVKLILMENTYFSTMYRFNGRYNPKVKDVLLFKEDFGNKFNSDIRNSLLFTNTQLFSTYPGFALYKQLYINKINDQKSISILSLNSSTAFAPQFWNISEISIDKQDSYIFRSCWDQNYHRKYVSKSNYISYPGYIEPKEISSFLASTIMNIPENIKIEMYSFTEILLNKNFDVEIIRNSENNIVGVLNNFQKLIKLLKPKLKPIFEKYVNSNFNFNKIDTLDDDIERYIITNILPRYFSKNVYAYIKYSSKFSNEPLIVSNKTEQELLVSGFTKLENIKFDLNNFSKFDYKFAFVKPSDKNVTLAFITDISVV